jgi:TerB N-terminal domain/TerB-C domain
MPSAGVDNMANPPFPPSQSEPAPLAQIGAATPEGKRALIARLSVQIDQIQRGSQRTSDARWVQPGEAVQVRGATVPGGAFYLGTALVSPILHGDDPALVNTDLKVDLASPVSSGADMQYWPAYGSISPAQRAAYLSWLAGDRNWTKMPIGFIFMYFYGFERRVFVDLLGTPRLDEELPWIRTEIERLGRVYGSNPSLRYYTDRFLWALDCLREPTESVEPPTVSPQGWQIPDTMKLGLGRLVAAGRPIPAQWALAWLKADPEAALRTPAERCPEEFGRLFALRYEQRYGEGLTIRPTKNMLDIRYRPASRSFGGVLLPVGKVPDVTSLKSPIRSFKALAQQCTDALDAFSRWVGRHPHDRTSLTALALLPPDLTGALPNEAFDQLGEWVGTHLRERDRAPLDGAQLGAFWPTSSKGKLTARQSASLCELLARRGYGVEPDARFGGPVIGRGTAVVFRAEGAETQAPAAQADWDRVLATLDLAMAAAALRQPDERAIDALADQLLQALELPAAQHRRVRAHLLWAALDSPNLNLAKRALAQETHQAREALGQFLVDLATRRGSVGPDQVSGLTRAYQALGLEPAAMFSLIHQRAVAPAAAPVEVRPPGSSQRGEAIPPPPGDAAGNAADGTIVLNPAALAATLAASAESTALLGKIFAEGDADEIPIPAPDPVAPGNLGGPHLALLGQLAGRDRWTHTEFVDLAARLDLLPNRALEVLNEAALDQAGDLVLEGDDVLSINHEVLKELLE